MLNDMVLSLSRMICMCALLMVQCRALQLRPRVSMFPNSRPVSQNDLRVLQRQTGQRNPANAAIGVPTCCSCRHGHPQAFALDPVPRSSGRMNSGLLKLTCPHLVNAVDMLEDAGMIQSFNDHFQGNQTWLRAAAEANNVHAIVRRQQLAPEDWDAIRSKLGPKGVAAFEESGVAGSSPTSSDLKCLHAHLADRLFRGAEAVVGEAVIDSLSLHYGVDISGTPDCANLCDTNSEMLKPPPVPRNKQRRQQKRRRRKQVSEVKTS